MRTRLTVNKWLLTVILMAGAFAVAAPVSRVTNFVDSNVLTASQLNSEFNNVLGGVNSINNAQIATNAQIAPSKIAGTIKGSGIERNGSTGALSVKTDNVTLEVSSDNVQIKDDGVTNAKIANDAVNTDQLADGAVTLDKIASAVLQQLIPVGSVLSYAGSAAPDSYLMADGACVSRTTYEDLFNVIGLAFGSCDGTDNFAVPDLRGIFIRGNGSWSKTFLPAAVNTTAETVTIVDHGFQRTGARVQVTSTGTNPGGILPGDAHYVIVVDEDTIAFASSISNAIANTRRNITSAGTGTITAALFEDTGETRLQYTIGSASSGLGSFQLPGTARPATTPFSFNHSHTYTGYNNLTTIPSGGGGTYSNIWQGTTTDDSGSTNPGTFPFFSGGDSETRPKNLNLNYIIKY